MTDETVRRLEDAHRRLTKDDPAIHLVTHGSLKAIISALLEIGNDLDELKKGACQNNCGGPGEGQFA